MGNKSEMEKESREHASTKKMLSYSIGRYISTDINNLVMFLFVFYETEIMLDVIWVGIAFVIFAIWNAINDSLLGYLTDRPFKFTKKWGMRFPWIVLGIIPTLIFWMLLFLPLEIDPANQLPVFLYFVIITCLMDTFYSIFSTHHGAAYNVHFPNEFERRKSGAINYLIPNIIRAGTVFLSPLIYVFGQKESATLFIFVTVLIYFVLAIFLIPGIRETDEIIERFLLGHEKKEKISFWKTMGIAFRNRNFVATTVMFLLASTGWALYGASTIYFAKGVLGVENIENLFYGIASLSGFALGVAFWIKVAKKIGNVKTMAIGTLSVFFVFLPILWITNMTQVVLLGFLAGFCMSGHSIMIMPIIADVYDEITIEIGRHMEAGLGGIRTFFNRFSLILAPIILTVIHLITQYDPSLPGIQLPLAQLGIRIHTALIPPLFYLAAFLGFLLLYKLTDEKARENKKKLIEMGL